ncbi:MAG: hypothetical protein LBP19_05165 [Treponema sp.]|jgi:hypothetical protein|nr:hypothetical protein [Treponema sp.]
MNNYEDEAVAQDMSRIHGGRCGTNSATYEDGYICEHYYAAPEQQHYAAICRLRWNMGSDTHEQDCAHIFYSSGKITPYSLLDLDSDYTRREADSLRGTQYEAEARAIVAAVICRQKQFLHEVKKGKLLKRDCLTLRFKIIDHWDILAPLARQEKTRAPHKARVQRTLKQGEHNTTMRPSHMSTPRRKNYRLHGKNC